MEDEMQHVGQAARRNCLAGNQDELTIPGRDSWMCSHFSWLRRAASLPYRLDGESAFHC